MRKKPLNEDKSKIIHAQEIDCTLENTIISLREFTLVGQFRSTGVTSTTVPLDSGTTGTKGEGNHITTAKYI